MAVRPAPDLPPGSAMAVLPQVETQALYLQVKEVAVAAVGTVESQ